MYYILYSHININPRKGHVTKKIKLDKIHLSYGTVFAGKNPPVRGTTQFKPMWSKGQVYRVG